MKWTKQETELLHRYFPHLENPILAEKILTSRTCQSIQSKAKRENIGKHNDYQITSSIFKARTASEISYSSDFKQFLWGVIVSEGTFVETYDKERDRKRFRFAIEMVEDELLDTIRSNLKIGNVHTIEKSNPNHSNTKVFVVESIGEISEKLIPLLDSIVTEDWKKLQKYNSWKKKFLEYNNIVECRNRLPPIDSDMVYTERHNRWPKEKEQKLIELYPALDKHRLSKVFPEKTDSAIRRKANRLGIEKIKDILLIQRISDYLSEDKPFVEDLIRNRAFIIGYISGDGSFHIKTEKSSPHFRLSITSNIDNKDNLERINSWFGNYGFVQIEEERKDEWAAQSRFVIHHLPFFLCTLVPILESGEWYSASKREQFESWRDSLYERVDIDTLWERVEQHEQAKRKYEQLTS